MPVLLQICAPFLVIAFGQIAAQVIGALLIGLFITVSLMVLAVTFKYLNERVVLTNQRVIAASRADLIWSHTTVIPICDVQHTYVAELGVGPILGFGDIAVKSAAEANPIDFFYGLPDVEEFATLVMATVESCRKGGA